MDRLLVTYYNSDANAQYIIQSTDDGQTWTNPVRIAPHHIGRNGAVSLAIDSNDILHLLFGERIPGVGSADIHGMWHTTFQNGNLNEVEPVVSGPLIMDKEGQSGFDPYDAHAIISQGKTLLVTWQTDPGNSKNGVWYSFITLDSPILTSIALPNSQEISSTAISRNTSEPTIANPTNAITLSTNFTPESSSASLPQNKAASANPMMPLLYGLIPVTLFVLSVVAFSVFRHFRN